MMSDWALDTVECRSGGNFKIQQQCTKLYQYRDTKLGSMIGSF